MSELDRLDQAMQWAKEHHPGASKYQLAAFANSVSYLVSGVSGGFGGPSVREHAVSLALAGDGVVGQVRTQLGDVPLVHPDPRMRLAGEWQFDAACLFAEPICFGPITGLHRRALRVAGAHFDDDPEDLEALQL